MTKITLNPVLNLIDSTTATNTINANSNTIQTAMDNTLSRDGTQPNTMQGNIDMNNNHILNLPAPANANEPARLADISNIAFGGSTFVNYAGPQTLTAGQQAQVQTNIGISNTSAAFTIKGNSTNTSAPTADISIPALTQKATPAAGDLLLLVDSAASNALKYATVSTIGTIGAVSSLNGQTGAVNFYFPPQGRLTLTSGTPVLGTSVAGATTLFYTPYQGNMVPIYNGTNMVPTAVAEISIATTDTTKNPSAIGVNKVNDWFVWNDSGTIRLSHGPDWTSDVVRSAGTALVLQSGIYLNSVTITNGPAASRGTYVGTTRSDGASTLNFIFGGIATNGIAGNLAVWNAYNRVPVTTMVGDSTTSWSYNTSNTWRAANNSATARISAVRGFDVDGIEATYMGEGISLVASNQFAVGVGLNSTTVPSGSIPFADGFTSGAAHTPIVARYSGLMGLGYNFVSALEFTFSGATTFYGNPVTYGQTGLHVNMFQ
jgi:hypothetical protein